MSIRKFMEEADKGYAHKAYFLHGSDPFFIKEAERIIKERVDDERKDFGLDIYDLDASSLKKPDIKEVLDSLNTFSFFAEDKIVIVQNLQKLKKAELEPLIKYLDDPAETSTLFMFYSGKPKATFRPVSELSSVISLDMSAGQLRSWMGIYAGEAGITLTAQAGEYIMDILSGDAGMIASEITKLSLLGKDRIDLKDIGDLIYGEAGTDTFELTRAISTGSRKKAFSLASEIIDTDPGMLVGAINWQVAKLKGKRPAATLRSYFKALLEADITNKSTGISYPTELLITKLLCR